MVILLYCEQCMEELNTWDNRLGKVLGFKLCEKCMAKEYYMSVDEFRNRMEDFLGMRPCQGI